MTPSSHPRPIFPFFRGLKCCFAVLRFLREQVCHRTATCFFLAGGRLEEMEMRIFVLFPSNPHLNTVFLMESS